MLERHAARRRKDGGVWVYVVMMTGIVAVVALVFAGLAIYRSKDLKMGPATIVIHGGDVGLSMTSRIHHPMHTYHTPQSSATYNIHHLPPQSQHPINHQNILQPPIRRLPLLLKSPSPRNRIPSSPSSPTSQPAATSRPCRGRISSAGSSERMKHGHVRRQAN